MFSKINDWLDSTLNLKESEVDKAHTSQLAAAILLLEVSRADFEISGTEKDVILQVLMQRFALAAEEAQAVLQYALDEHEQYSSAHPFIRLLNEELNQQDKLGLLEGLWEVAYADSELDKYEEYHIRKIADWLYLSHADFIRLKHKVLAALNIPRE